ncbi:MAG: DASS family sodium-coupled anion symporter [Holophagales bacterium]|nr:DASS family sodium-coupled anion symporter [Holophagales bacterium]
MDAPRRRRRSAVKPTATPTGDRPRPWSELRRLGLFAGPLLALLAYRLLPETYLDAAGAPAALTSGARATLAVMVWMATWWLTEAIDIAATALLPILLFPLLGVAKIDEATAPYASSVIFLFFGGFVLALSMQRWRLDRRIALGTLRLVGTRPAQMIGGFMLATAGLSAFVSNTATTALMLPIAASVLTLAASGRGGGGGGEGDARRSPFAIALMLSIAYAASIGGLATIIGTPPNLFLVAYLRDEHGIDVSFVGWLRVGVPLVVVLLPATWWLLTRRLFKVGREPIPGAEAAIREALAGLGAMSAGERNTLVVFATTALAWIFRPLLASVEIAGARPFARLTDAGIAMFAALALFVLPADWQRRTFTMDWPTAQKLPWGVLLLFGGGLSLASAVQHHRVAEFLGAQAHRFAGWPALAIVLAVTAATIFLTELTSNTATAATLVPILAALAPGLGLPMIELVLPATLAASCAFMLPVATPPNAIVFGSGYVDQPTMARTGLWLNLLALLPIVALAFAGLLPLG